MSREAFGPNLRRIRVQRRISLEDISVATKIPLECLAGLESNDFSTWPIGLFARAYVRQYAEAIGVDPDATVDEFCRWFPEGDRRAERLVREQSDIVGHELEWHDEIPETGDRRHKPGRASTPVVSPASPSSSVSALFFRVRRAFHKA